MGVLTDGIKAGLIILQIVVLVITFILGIAMTSYDPDLVVLIAVCTMLQGTILGTLMNLSTKD